MKNTNTKSQKLSSFCHFYYYYSYFACAGFPFISQFKMKFIYNYMDVNFPFCEFPLKKINAKKMRKEKDKRMEKLN